MVLPSEIASIASAISGLTASVSLIYVGIQTRLSVRHTRALIQQGTTARTTSILLGQMNAEATAIWIDGNGGTPTPKLIRERQFHYQCGIAMIALSTTRLRIPGNSSPETTSFGLATHRKIFHCSRQFRSERDAILKVKVRRARTLALRMAQRESAGRSEKRNAKNSPTRLYFRAELLPYFRPMSLWEVSCLSRELRLAQIAKSLVDGARFTWPCSRLVVNLNLSWSPHAGEAVSSTRSRLFVHPN
jgi:hypothetical protein